MNLSYISVLDYTKCVNCQNKCLYHNILIKKNNGYLKQKNLLNKDQEKHLLGYTSTTDIYLIDNADPICKINNYNYINSFLVSNYNNIIDILNKYAYISCSCGKKSWICLNQCFIKKIKNDKYI